MLSAVILWVQIGQCNSHLPKETNTLHCCKSFWHIVHIKNIWAHWSRSSGVNGELMLNISCKYCFAENDFPHRQSWMPLALSTAFRIKSNLTVGRLITYWCPSMSRLLPHKGHKGSHLFQSSAKECFLLYSLTSDRPKPREHYRV